MQREFSYASHALKTLDQPSHHVDDPFSDHLTTMSWRLRSTGSKTHPQPIKSHLDAGIVISSVRHRRMSPRAALRSFEIC